MEGSELDYIEDEGKMVCCDRCDCNQGVDQFFGFCPTCWMDITPQQRAVLRGEEPPVKEIIERTFERTVYPSLVSVRLFRLWCFAVTAALAWLAWKGMR